MAKFKLEIGERYVTRDGTESFRIVRLARKEDPSYRKSHPYVDEEGYAYMPDGRVDPHRIFPFDLVAKKTKNK